MKNINPPSPNYTALQSAGIFLSAFRRWGDVSSKVERLFLLSLPMFFMSISLFMNDADLLIVGALMMYLLVYFGWAKDAWARTQVSKIITTLTATLKTILVQLIFSTSVYSESFRSFIPLLPTAPPRARLI